MQRCPTPEWMTQTSRFFLVNQCSPIHQRMTLIIKHTDLQQKLSFKFMIE